MRLIIGLALVTTLSGCDSSLTVREVCEQTPAMCNDLNTDSHCRHERAEVIISRFHEYEKPTLERKYQLLKDFERYSQCVNLASKIEHIKLKEKTASRYKGYHTAQKEINRLLYETRGSNHPGLLYFHWSRNNDNSALQKLLSMQEDTKVKNSRDAQFYLASYYMKVDTQKTLDHLYRSLELNGADQQPHPEVLTSLVNIFYQQEQYNLAYTFAVVAKQAGVENIDFAPLRVRALDDGHDLERLDTLAQTTYEQITSGQFRSPRS